MQGAIALAGLSAGRHLALLLFMPLPVQYSSWPQPPDGQGLTLGCQGGGGVEQQSGLVSGLNLTLLLLFVPAESGPIHDCPSLILCSFCCFAGQPKSL